MKRAAKWFVSLLTCLLLACSFVLVGCDSRPSVVSIEKSNSNGLEDTYTITYSDGTTFEFTVTNGKDESVEDIWQTYIEVTGEEITFAEFLEKYLTISGDSSVSINECLLSAAKVYTEFVEQTWSMTGSSKKLAMYTGGAIIYGMGEEYTYFVTNYHVVYDRNAALGESKIARKITCYLYGSEGIPAAVDENGDGRADTDENGYVIYNYGDYAIDCEYVGGSITSDLAVLRADTDDVLAINEDAKAVRIADGYHVGETAFTIGNPNNGGISVTEGIVSVDNEYIQLNIDGTTRSYRSIRIDTPLYSGNSGGGLFNKEGELIGIANAGNEEEQNINYAIPLDIVTGTVGNILYFANDNDKSTDGAYTPMLGINTLSQNSRYVYDSVSGYGTIAEDVMIQSVKSGSIADKMGLFEGDKITSIVVGGVQTEIYRSFNISDVKLTMRPGDTLVVGYVRDGNAMQSKEYVLKTSDFTAFA